MFNRGLTNGQALAVVLMAAVFLLFVFMLTVSWGRWGDLIVDFGRELYLPWQVSEGAVLYQDLAHPFGPFSVYFNALGMKIFGEGLWTIFGLNLALVLIIGFLLYTLVAAITDRVTGLVGVVVFIGLFAFGNYIDTANYSYISPYSHELVHGLIAGLLLLLACIRYVKTRHVSWFLIGGLAFGITLLTKPEVVLAVGGTFAVFATWFFWDSRQRTLKSALWQMAIFIGGAALPSALFLFMLSSSLGLTAATDALLRPYHLVLGQGEGPNVFYQRWLGFDRPLINLGFLLLASFFYGLVAAVIGGAVYIKKRIKVVGGSIVLIVIFAIAAWSLLVGLPRQWLLGYSFRALPLFSLGASVVAAFYFFQRREQPGDAIQFLPTLLFSVFAFLLTLKMVLFSRIFHYGFVLGLPSTLVLVEILIYYFPCWLNKRGLDFGLARGLGVVLVALIIIVHVSMSATLYRAKSTRLSGGFDTVMVRPDRRSAAVAGVLEWFKANLRPGEGFVVMPEGIMLNYLSRVPSPARSVNFLEIIFRGERTLLKDLESSNPEYIIWIPRDTVEYGYRWGRAGFGEMIIDWRDRNYQSLNEIKTGEYTITIFDRRREDGRQTIIPVPNSAA